MALHLPRLVLAPNRGPSGGFGFPDELVARALELHGLAGESLELVVPAGAGRWLVGRSLAGTTVFRLVDRAGADRIGTHPAWLLTADPWFDADVDAAALPRAPAALPLRHVVRLMAPLGRRHRRTVKALAATVAALRAGQRPAGVRVTVDDDLLASASHPARWFVLALLATLPPARREPLSIGIGTVRPGSGLDLVVGPRSAAPGDLGLQPRTPSSVDGSRERAPGAAIDVSDPPDEGEDLVAFFVRHRLYDDDPEAVESAAWLFDGDDDRWGQGIASLIRDGATDRTAGGSDLLESDPERAVRALTARLRAGAPLDAATTADLVRATLATRDPRPWRALSGRSPVQRADAVDALLEHAAALRPGDELLSELGALYPRGAPLDRWIPALLGWLSLGTCIRAAVATTHATLLEWPLSATGPTRASVWAEVVGTLVRLGEDDAAMDALVSPLAAEIARDGAGRALVAGWATVPAAFRTAPRMDALVAMLHGVPDGDRAVTDLFRLVRAHDDEASALVRAWVRRTASVPAEDDPLFALVRETPWLRAWAEALLDAGGGLSSRRRSLPASGGVGPLWSAVAEVVVERAPGPRAAVLALASLASPAPAAAHALRLLGPALDRQRAFPDAELAGAAEVFARIPGADPAWSWVTVTAAAPDLWDEAVVDATVVEVLQGDLADATEALVRRASVLLGAAAGWEPLDLARWVVRITLSRVPDPGEPSPLVAALLEGVAQRKDAEAFLAGTLSPLLDLGPEHPAPGCIVASLQAAGWRGAPLGRVIGIVGAERFPTAVVPFLTSLLGET